LAFTHAVLTTGDRPTNLVQTVALVNYGVTAPEIPSEMTNVA
jgi:hypothetical protein